MGAWLVTPLFSFRAGFGRKTFVVKASEPPPVRQLTTPPDFPGLRVTAAINEREKNKPDQKTTPLKWTGKADAKRRSLATFPVSWAAVAVGTVPLGIPDEKTMEVDAQDMAADDFVPQPHLNVAPMTPPMPIAPAAATATAPTVSDGTAAFNPTGKDVQNAFEQIGALQADMASLKTLIESLACRLPAAPAAMSNREVNGEDIPQGKGCSKPPCLHQPSRR